MKRPFLRWLGWLLGEWRVCRHCRIYGMFVIGVAYRSCWPTGSAYCGQATHDPAGHAVAVGELGPVELRAQLEQLLGQHAFLTVRLACTPSG